MKIKYWPNKPSINLNNTVVELFIETEKKLLLAKYNKSNKYLYIDILNSLTKNHFFKIILSEFKELILDLIEINLNAKTITIISKKINKIFINRVSEKLLLQSHFKDLKEFQDEILINQDNSLIDTLLIYLMFGSASIENNIFIFEKVYTPYNHVRILLENFIIDTSNIVIKTLISKLSNSENINKLLNQKQICNKLYSSNRSIILFINNLKWQDTTNSYIYDIKSLYNERKKVLIIDGENIVVKYIYLSQIKKIKKLNQIQIIFILWLEIKDLIIPKIERFIIQITKYLLYCSINLLSNLILILIRIIVFYLNTEK
uniref:Uncharacterized protein n=1 Tax=Herposiphonia versicolor TaxID=2007163 RepID=A0A1Z1MF32_9FLOR|nr:hypothetical protein [Herposiphonia versicolor]ARW64687.1 hypothetical protein [Herposiphonia versicolor]